MNKLLLAAIAPIIVLIIFFANDYQSQRQAITKLEVNNSELSSALDSKNQELRERIKNSNNIEALYAEVIREKDLQDRKLLKSLNQLRELKEQNDEVNDWASTPIPNNIIELLYDEPKDNNQNCC